MLTAEQAVRCARCAQQWQPVEAAASVEAAQVKAVIAEPRARSQPRLPARPPIPAWPREGREVREVPDGRDNEWGALAIDRLMGEKPSPPRTGLGLQLAWMVSIVVVAAAVVAVYAWRDEVMVLWPAATRLYAALGLVE
jgi:hypothetical protein